MSASDFPRAGLTKQALKVEPLPLDLSSIQLPQGIELKSFQRAINVARRRNKHEEISTGMLLVLEGDESEVYTEPIDDHLNAIWTKYPRFLSNDEEEANFRFLFLQDGGMLVHGRSTKVLATASKFFEQPGCIWKSDGHGCKHNSAVNLTHFQPCVAVVRSAVGTVTVFIHKHTQQGVCFRLDASDDTLLARMQLLEVALMKQNEVVFHLRRAIERRQDNCCASAKLSSDDFGRMD